MISDPASTPQGTCSPATIEQLDRLIGRRVTIAYVVKHVEREDVHVFATGAVLSRTPHGTYSARIDMAAILFEAAHVRGVAADQIILHGR